VISPTQRTLPNNIQHLQKNPCSGGIRSRNASKRGATDPRLKPRHWDRLNCLVIRRYSVL